MWMMGYNECGAEFNMNDSCTGRKLRPLIPRPNNPCNRINDSDFISLNYHHAYASDQAKREFNTQPVVVSSRWNPTPEQLRTLEELYRRGTRTPTADQIQQITAQLRRFGKIEGKNVFYWFQNHKARERQKRRRQMESCPDNDQHGHDADIFDRKESGAANRTAYEVDQTKIWLPSTNCTTLSEEVGSMQRAGKVVGASESCRAVGSDGWMQSEDGEFVFQHHHRRSFMEKNATWQMMQLSCPPPPTTTHHHLINNVTTSTTTTSTCTTSATCTSMAASTTLPTTITVLPPSSKLIKSAHDNSYFNIFIAPCIENGLIGDEDGCGGESQTLQLFPLRSCGGGGGGGDGDIGINEKDTSVAMNAHFTTPYQFFEFLPMKN